MEKCVLCVGGLGRDCVAGRGDSQSKHTRSILIPRSVAVNVEAEAEYISRRRNEVSLLVNKQAGAAAARGPGRARTTRLQEFYFHDKRHVLINCSHLRY